MKKVLFSILAICLSVTFAGCSSNENTPVKEDAENYSEVPSFTALLNSTSATISRMPVYHSMIDSMIRNVYFPEATSLRTFQDISSCTDLRITVDDTELFASYAWDGNSSVSGQVWAYTYPDNVIPKSENDVTFLGGATLDDVKNRRNFIYDNASGPSISYQEKSLGKLKAGYKVGFLFRGNTNTWGWSTPSLNGKHSGKVVRLPGQPVYSGNPARCLIYHTLTSDGKEYNILGCENRFPEEAKYDGDYNDMVVLLRSVPPQVYPETILTPPGDEPLIVKVPSKFDSELVCEADDFLVRVDGQYISGIIPDKNVVTVKNTIAVTDGLTLKLSSLKNIPAGKEYTYEIYLWILPENFNKLSTKLQDEFLAGTDISAKCETKCPSFITDFRKNVYEGVHIDKWGNREGYIKISVHVSH